MTPKRQRIAFHFDETSMEPLDKLRAQGRIAPDMERFLQTQDEHRALQQDYPRLCGAAWATVNAYRKHDSRENGGLNLDHAMQYLWATLRGLNAACRCDPPGSGEEHCTGHCMGYQSPMRRDDQEAP